MISHIIRFSVKNKLMVMIGIIALIITGVYSMAKLPLDAVPDITNNQVQIVTTSSSLAPQEVEQFITFPVENAMANIPGVEDIRSISRFGLSVVTVVFKEDVPILEARQFVKEQIDIASKDIPNELGMPEMMPITTGLGEIYQYVLQVDSAYAEEYDNIELRTIQDWIVKKQLMGVKGIIDVSSFGGFLKQYEVAVDPLKMEAQGVTMDEVFTALEKNNQNSGGSYIEKGDNAYYIRTEGLVTNLQDIEVIVVKSNDESPVLIRDISTVGFGYPPRYGALTMDGKGEAVGGITLMLKGSNSSEAIQNVQERIARIQKALPAGVSIYPYLDRSVLVGKTIHTVAKNLIEGGLIVIFVLILLLGNFRAGLIVASVIPLALLFAFIIMNLTGVSANLMSLGAIDFGIVIDGAVIVVEGVLHFVHAQYKGQKLNQLQMDDVIVSSSSKIIGSASFGVLIIIVVFVPIMTLTGIEGKMFTPMALTVSYAIIGALLLSITYVPMMSALVLKKEIKEHNTFSDRIINGVIKGYKPILTKAVQFPKTVIVIALSMLVVGILLFSRLGAEFIPTLEEGDLAMQLTIPPGSSLTKMVETSTETERILKENFPEVIHVVSKIGTAEIPTDPMAVEDGDVMILLKEKEEWTSANDREELIEKMKEKLSTVKDAEYNFSQPIELRFNELISGSKSDLAIKLYGDDLEELSMKGKEIVNVVSKINGAGDVKLEQTEGLPQLMIRIDREKLALHELSIEEVNRVIRASFAGEFVGTVYEGQKRFDMVVRLEKDFRQNVDLGQLFIHTPNNVTIPISEVATISLEDGPMQISRDNAQRRISVGVNVRNRDLASFVEDVQKQLNAKIKLPTGYFLEYGGQFENLEAAKARLLVAVPIALGMILFLLYLAFKSLKYSLLIYATVPLAAIGGIVALLLRGMPFSISAGVGFIALFGVAVLNGIVLISYFNRLKDEGETSIKEIVLNGSIVRLRPVLMTATVASLGFLPMAIATSAGAEVQKPLATVVIGGLISATLLTLIVLPTLYAFVHKKDKQMKSKNATIVMLLMLVSLPSFGQNWSKEMLIDSALTHNVQLNEVKQLLGLNKLDQRSSFALGNTALTYQYGQMNTQALDNYVQIDQEIGNLLNMIRNKQFYQSNEEVLLGRLGLIERKIRMEVSNMWLDWQAQNLIVNVIEEQKTMFGKHLDQMKIQFEMGEKSSLDYSLTELQLAELEKMLHDHIHELHITRSSLSQWTGISSIPIRDTSITFESLSLAEPAKDFNREVLLAEEMSKLDAIQAERKANTSQLFPNLSLGYFNQSLDYDRGYQGAIIGVSMPLFNSDVYRSKKRAQLKSAYQQEVIKMTENTLDVNYQSTLLMYQHARELMNEFDENWNQKAELLDKAAEQELSLGEVNYFIYLQSKIKVMEIKIMGIELKQHLMQASNELEYYTK